jgi:hypothetical protein
MSVGNLLSLFATSISLSDNVHIILSFSIVVTPKQLFSEVGFGKFSWIKKNVLKVTWNMLV